MPTVTPASTAAWLGATAGEVAGAGPVLGRPVAGGASVPLACGAGLPPHPPASQVRLMATAISPARRQSLIEIMFV